MARGSTFGNGLATFGRGYALFSSIASTIVGLIFIVIGIGLVMGKIKPPAPKPGMEAHEDDKISPETLGWIMIGFGVFIIIASWLWTYATQKYRGAAQAEGALGIASIFNNVT